MAYFFPSSDLTLASPPLYLLCAGEAVVVGGDICHYRPLVRHRLVVNICNRAAGPAQVSGRTLG